MITNIREPLGRMSGNATEIVEWSNCCATNAIRLPRICVAFRSSLRDGCLPGRQGSDPEDGTQLAEDLLSGGLPLKKLGCMIEAQGGDLAWFDSPQWLHKPAHQYPVKSPSAGFLSNVDCDQVGWAVQRSGAGRTVPGEAVSAHAGVETHKKLGDHVAAGETLFTVYVEDDARRELVAAILNRSFTLSAEWLAPEPLIYQVIA